MTSATSLREQNTNSQKSCSKTLCTCNNSSWFLTPFLSTCFPLSDHKLRGHEGAEPERQRPGAALAQNAPSSCLHSSSLFSLQHLLLQPHYAACISDLHYLSFALSLDSSLRLSELPSHFKFTRLFSSWRVKDTQQLRNDIVQAPLASLQYGSQQVGSAVGLLVAEKTKWLGTRKKTRTNGIKNRVIIWEELGWTKTNKCSLSFWSINYSYQLDKQEKARF